MSAVRELLFADWSTARMWAQARAGWRRFAGWWLAELRDLLPGSIVDRLYDRGEPMIRLEAGPDGIRIEVISPGGRVTNDTIIDRANYSTAALDRHLAGLGRKRHGAVIGIVLPSSAIFHRTFSIPARARDRIHTMARQELEHRTPFRAEDVHLGMAVGTQPSGAQTLSIHQSIVRRDVVETAAGDLDLAPREVAFVTTAIPQGGAAAPSIPLRHESDLKATSPRQMIPALAAAAAVLVCVDVGLLWWTQESAIVAIEAQAASERDKALTVRSLEDEMTRVQVALRALEERRRLASTTDLWRETSRVLPDNTWVTDWRRRNASVSVAGFSETATALVTLFEKSPLFGEASLDAPITIDGVTGRERFSLILRMPATARLAQR